MSLRLAVFALLLLPLAAVGQARASTEVFQVSSAWVNVNGGVFEVNARIDYPLEDRVKAALDVGCFYVGALGSRKTHAKRVERLLAAGATPEQIERIHAPIGIDIGVSSPAEIAVAVLAQVIGALRSRGDARARKDAAA